MEEGTAVFALPNDMHRQRCEEYRAEAEAVLAGHFGRPVPLRLVVDAEVVEAGPVNGGAAETAGAVAVTTEPEDDERSIDPAELVDAEGEHQGPVDQLVEAFGAVEVIENDPTTE